MKLWLVGMMGSGKTSVGTLASHVLGVGFVDTDAGIEKATGASVAQVWENSGEAGFRQLESEALISAASVEDAIIATGGGAVVSPHNRSMLQKTGSVVWLQAGPEVALARLGDDTARPLLATEDPLSEYQRILDLRISAYAEVADYEIDTDELTLEETVSAVVSIWNL